MRTTLPLVLVFVLGVPPLLVGCTNESSQSQAEPRFQTLVAPDEWRPVARDADPFITDLDAAPECVASGVRVEEQWLELDTSECSWITLVARARFEVERGRELRVTLSHFDLSAPAAAEGRTELTFDTCEAWSKPVTIPSAAAVYTEIFASRCALAAGGRVYFHLHNHGQDTWQLQDISVLR